MSPPAKQRGGIIAPLSAARTAQRAVPTRFRVQSAKISWNSFHEPESGSPALQRVGQFRFMDREQVRKEHGAFHEAGGARLRRVLIAVFSEIRARRSLAPPFMVPMRGGKTVEASMNLPPLPALRALSPPRRGRGKGEGSSEIFQTSRPDSTICPLTVRRFYGDDKISLMAVISNREPGEANPNQRAFTLIELLVVIAIIAILA